MYIKIADVTLIGVEFEDVLAARELKERDRITLEGGSGTSVEAEIYHITKKFSGGRAVTAILGPPVTIG